MHNGYNNGFPVEGCAPDPNYFNPYSELARRDPIIAIALEQARETGAALEANRFMHRDVRNLEEKAHKTQEKLDRANREVTYSENNLEAAYEDLTAARETIAKLEKKVKPTKKVVKKSKKVSKK